MTDSRECFKRRETRQADKTIPSVNRMDNLLSPSTQSSTHGPEATGTLSVKLDPRSIYKSKRYRDKLRTEIKGLEGLLPVDKSTVHRKLDSQTVFRLSIAYFRTKLFLKGVEKGKSSPINNSTSEENKDDDVTSSEDADVTRCQARDLVQATSLLEMLDGFLLIVTADGTILFVSSNILQQLGFNQVDLMLRCIYGIVHPDDHEELKMVLEQTLAANTLARDTGNQRPCCSSADVSRTSPACSAVSFLCRMKCFSGSTTGYLKMHCIGHMRSFPSTAKSKRTSNQVLFAFCRPFIPVNADISKREGAVCTPTSSSLWTKHELDLHFKQMDEKVKQVLGYSTDELVGRSLYEFIHPEDLSVFRYCHKALIHTEEIQTLYFRAQQKDGTWLWLHTRGKVVIKSSKKYSIVFTHCPVREEDSTYIQQEAIVRRRYAIEELMCGQGDEIHHSNQYSLQGAPHSTFSPLSSHGPVTTPSSLVYGGLKDDASTSSLHDPHGHCPSSWHTTSDRHSPVFPNTQQMPLRHQQYHREYSHDVSRSYNPHHVPETSFQGLKKRKLEMPSCQPACHNYSSDQWCNDYNHSWCSTPEHLNQLPVSNQVQVTNPSVGTSQCNNWIQGGCNSSKSLHNGLQQTNWPVAPYTMVIEGRLTINTNQVPQPSCCYYNENNFQSHSHHGNGYTNTQWSSSQWMSLQESGVYPACELSSNSQSTNHQAHNSSELSNCRMKGKYSERTQPVQNGATYYDYPEITSCFDAFPAEFTKLDNKCEARRPDCLMQNWM